MRDVIVPSHPARSMQSGVSAWGGISGLNVGRPRPEGIRLAVTDRETEQVGSVDDLLVHYTYVTTRLAAGFVVDCEMSALVSDLGARAYQARCEMGEPAPTSPLTESQRDWLDALWTIVLNHMHAAALPCPSCHMDVPIPEPTPGHNTYADPCPRCGH